MAHQSNLLGGAHASSAMLPRRCPLFGVAGVSSLSRRRRQPSPRMSAPPTTKCIATSPGFEGGGRDESADSEKEPKWPWGGRQRSSDAPQSPPGVSAPSSVTGDGSLLAGSLPLKGKRTSSESSLKAGAALPLSLLHPYERLPDGDKARASHAPGGRWFVRAVCGTRLCECAPARSASP
jgi:hypothetical protein